MFMRVIKTMKWFLIPAGVVLVIFGGSILLGKKPVKPVGNLGVNVEKSAMELCGAQSCLDLASQGIDGNQWDVLLAVIQEVENQGYLSNLKGIQTGDVLKEKIVLLDDLVSEQAKELPIEQTTSTDGLLGSTGLTLGQLLEKAKLAKVIY